MFLRKKSGGVHGYSAKQEPFYRQEKEAKINYREEEREKTALEALELAHKIRRCLNIPLKRFVYFAKRDSNPKVRLFSSEPSRLFFMSLERIEATGGMRSMMSLSYLR